MTTLFLQTSVWHPMPSELYDYAPSDLAELATPLVFATREAAVRNAETRIAEWNRDSEFEGDDDLVLVAEHENGTMVFAPEGTDPANSEGWDACVFFYVTPTEVLE